MIASIRMIRRKHIEIAGAINGPRQVKVGLPAGKVGSDLVSIAIWNHYGTRGGGWGGPIPARPFILQAIQNNRKKYIDALKTSASKLVRGETTLETVMSKLGSLAADDVKMEISSGNFVPNSPVTIALKGSDRPLVDTGRLRNSITWELKR